MILEELVALLGFQLEGEGDLKAFANGLQSAERNAKQAAGSIGVLGVAVGSFFGNLAAQAALKLGDIVGSFPGDVISTTAQFEGFETALTTIEGTAEKARASMNWIQKFAQETPYELAGVTDAFVKLKAYGIEPIDGTLRTLGDAASALNKPLNQAVEMFADASTFQFERLREFGIVASQKGDEVTFKWDKNGKSLTKTVKKSGDEIRRFLLENLGDRFNGAMVRQSKTWNGMLSNLSDAWQNFQLRIGRSGFFDLAKNKLADLLDAIGDLTDDGSLDRWAKKASNALETAFRVLSRLVNLARHAASWIGKAFDSLGQAIADGLRWISGGAIDLSNMEALAAAGALLFGAINPLAAAFVAGGLAVDDFLAYLEGGDSVIGKWIDQLPNFAAAFDKVAPGVRSAVQSTIALLQEGDWAGAGIMASEAFLRGWTALSAGLQPYIDGALSYLSSVDWIGAINRGLSNATVAISNVNWGDVGAEGGRIGVIIATALVAALVAEIQAASALLGKAVKDGLMNVSWSDVGSLIVASLKAQFDLITGIIAGISQQIIATIEGWFNIDLTGIGARWAGELLAGLQSMGGAIRDWFASLIPGWAKDWFETADRNAAAADAGDRVGGMVPPRADGTADRVADPATRRINAAFAGGPANDNPALADALQRIAAGLAAVNGDNAGQKVQETIANDNRVLNQSNTVNAPVTVNATLTNTTPGAVGAAAGAGVRSAGNAAVRSLAVTGSPSFGGPR